MDDQSATPAVKEEEQVEEQVVVEEEGNTEPETQPEPTPEPKKSRAESRIQQLVGKLKDQTPAKEIPWGQPDPLEGKSEITREDLERKIQIEADKRVQLALQNQSVQNQAQSWLNDLHGLVKDNPELNPESTEYNADLDEALQDLIFVQQAGQIMPRDISKPVSEVYGKLKKALGNERVKGQQETTVSIAEKIATEAVRPTNTRPSKMSQSDLKELMKKDPGAVRRMLEETLPVGED